MENCLEEREISLEKVQEQQLMQTIISNTPRKDIVDKLLWKEDKNGIFIVKSAYNAIRGVPIGENNGVFTYLRNLKTSLNLLHFGCKVIIEKIPTKVALWRRGVVVGDIRCVMCKEKEETISHLFFNCAITKRVWNQFDNWEGVCFVHHNHPLINF